MEGDEVGNSTAACLHLSSHLCETGSVLLSRRASLMKAARASAASRNLQPCFKERETLAPVAHLASLLALLTTSGGLLARNRKGTQSSRTVTFKGHHAKANQVRALQRRASRFIHSLSAKSGALAPFVSPLALM